MSPKTRRADHQVRELRKSGQGRKREIEKQDPAIANNNLIFPSEQFTKNCFAQVSPPGDEAAQQGSRSRPSRTWSQADPTKQHRNRDEEAGGSMKRVPTDDDPPASDSLLAARPGPDLARSLLRDPHVLHGELSLKTGSLETGYQLTWAFENYTDSISEYSTQFIRAFWYAGVATFFLPSDRYPLAYAIAFRRGAGRT